MRILWVKIGGLWPPNSGGRLRSYNLLRQLSRDHDVTLATTRDPGAAEGALASRLPDCREVVEIPFRLVKHGDPRFVGLLLQSWLAWTSVDVLRCRVPKLAAAVESRLRAGGFDLCVADFLCAVPNVPLSGPVPVVLFQHNVEHMIWKRLARTSGLRPRRLPLEIEWRRLRRFETRACMTVARTLTVSEQDRDLLSVLSPGASVEAVPTGVDVGYFRPRPDVAERREIVFLGSMDWYPNEDGMRWFIAAVLPAIRRRCSDVSVTVVGRRPSPGFVRMAHAHGVEVTGTVVDVREYLARAALCVVPLRVGGGTRLKIFEQLAMGKATVTTTVGAEGLPVRKGREVVVADGAGDFAAEVVDLLEDPERRRRLGKAGRQLVVEDFSWERVACEFVRLCSGAVVARRERETVAGHGRRASAAG